MFIMKLCESKLDGHPVNNIGHLCGKPHGYARHNDRCSSTAFRLCCHSHQKRESIVFLARFLHNIQRDSPTVVVEGKRLQFWDMDTMTVDRFEDERFSAHYIPELFTPADLIQQFQHLLIVPSLSSTEYFMPSLLQMITSWSEKL